MLVACIEQAKQQGWHQSKNHCHHGALEINGIAHMGSIVGVVIRNKHHGFQSIMHRHQCFELAISDCWSGSVKDVL